MVVGSGFGFSVVGLSVGLSVVDLSVVTGWLVVTLPSSLPGVFASVVVWLLGFFVVDSVVVAEPFLSFFAVLAEPFLLFSEVAALVAFSVVVALEVVLTSAFLSCTLCHLFSECTSLMDTLLGVIPEKNDGTYNNRCKHYPYNNAY